MRRFEYYDFFAGVGLAQLGFDPAHWTCAWSNDLDPAKKAIYARNFDATHYVLRDIRDVTANDLPQPVDLAWASFPCQDLSLAGWRRGLSGQRSGTFWAFHRIMSDLHAEGRRPPLIVLENVVGLLHDPDFAGLCASLADLGMQFGAVVLDAKHFVPQSRPRVFVIAVDSALDVSPFTMTSEIASPWITPSVRSAWESLPDRSAVLWRWWKIPFPLHAVADVRESIDAEPAGVSWHSDEHTRYLLSLMTSTNLRKVHTARQSGARQVGFLYRRTRNGQQRAEVRFDGLAGCLRTTLGGSSRQTVVIVDGDSLRSRLLSPREAARLMGVPDTYALPGRYNDAYRAMGDGVVAPVVGWLARELLLPIARLLDDASKPGGDASCVAAVSR